MQITPKQLGEAGIRIIDLSKACKVTEPAVYKWLSKKEIPNKFVPKLETLLNKRVKATSVLLFKTCNEID